MMIDVLKPHPSTHLKEIRKPQTRSHAVLLSVSRTDAIGWSSPDGDAPDASQAVQSSHMAFSVDQRVVKAAYFVRRYSVKALYCASGISLPYELLESLVMRLAVRGGGGENSATQKLEKPLYSVIPH
jgi:hypothetical protein